MYTCNVCVYACMHACLYVDVCEYAYVMMCIFIILLGLSRLRTHGGVNLAFALPPPNTTAPGVRSKAVYWALVPAVDIPSGSCILVSLGF